MESQIERLERKIDTLHDCIDGMREEQSDIKQGMSTYFLGVPPETHVRHHNSLVDNLFNKTETKRVSKEAISIIAATLILNIAGYAYVNSGIEKRLNSTNTEQVKK